MSIRLSREYPDIYVHDHEQLKESAYTIHITQRCEDTTTTDCLCTKSLQAMIAFLYKHNPDKAKISIEIEVADPLQIYLMHTDKEVHRYLLGTDENRKIPSEIFQNRAILLACERYLGYIIPTLLNRNYEYVDIADYIFYELKTLYTNPEDPTSIDKYLLRSISSVINSALDVAELRNDNSKYTDIVDTYATLLVNYYRQINRNAFSRIQTTVKRKSTFSSWDGDIIHDMLYGAIYDCSPEMAFDYIDYLDSHNIKMQVLPFSFATNTTIFSIINSALTNKSNWIDIYRSLICPLTNRSYFDIVAKISRVFNIQANELVLHLPCWFVIYLKIRYHLK